MGALLQWPSMSVIIHTNTDELLPYCWKPDPVIVTFDTMSVLFGAPVRPEVGLTLHTLGRVASVQVSKAGSGSGASSVGTRRGEGEHETTHR